MLQRSSMYVIGTAGHVDHGKSTLIETLTGIDPDRLAEERKREMTIDLGFAWMELPSGIEVSIVDVPGHERFIQNMLSGIGSIDLGLLVVACDESVMAQTKEHITILDLLGIKKAIVALTKSDLVEPDWLTLVKEDVMSIISETSIENAGTIPVSAINGSGIAGLITDIDRVVQSIPRRADLGRPRLPIDRSFTMPGFGAVVTGTLLDGSLAIGSEVELLPSHLKGRIRGLQVHQKSVETVEPGHRVAVNITGVSHTEINRGDILTSPGWLGSTSIIDVQLRIPKSSSRLLKHNMGITVHTGTFESTARIRLLDSDKLNPGESGWGQIHLDQPATVVKGDKLIVRSSSSTLAGAEIVDPAPQRHKRNQPRLIEHLRNMYRGSIRQVVLEVVATSEPTSLQEIAAKANLSDSVASDQIAFLVGDGSVIPLPTGPMGSTSYFYSSGGWDTFTSTISNLLRNYHRQFPLKTGMPKEHLRSQLKLSTNVFPHILSMLTPSAIVLDNSGMMVHLPDHTVQFNEEQARQAAAFLATLQQQIFVRPSNQHLDEGVLQTLIDRGQVLRLNESVLCSKESYTWISQSILRRFAEQPTLTVADVRDLLQTSRKYAIAILEYMDQLHITRRMGDDRILMDQRMLDDPTLKKEDP